MLKPFVFFILLFSALALAVPYEVSTVKEGSGEGIKAGQLIQVHYKGWLTDSTLFDDSYERGEPLEFTLGVGQVIAGWDRGLAGMKVGEVRRLAIPSAMAYGDRSLGPIPANADLLFEVELVHAEQPLPPDVLLKDVGTAPWKQFTEGVYFIDEKKGEGPALTTGMRAKIHYTGWIYQGRKFISTKDLGKPMDITLGTGKLIKGFETGLEGLKPGAVRWLKISPFMAYGNTPLTTIPPNSTLIFRVELLKAESDEALAETLDFFPDVNSLTLQDGPEGLKYAIIKKGEGAPAPANANVRVHYTGWLTNGTKFDSSRDRGQIFNFTLGAGRVIRGWDLGVEGMLPGEKRVLVVPPGLGYGSRGGGPIPGDATLIFTVEYLGE